MTSVSCSSEDNEQEDDEDHDGDEDGDEEKLSLSPHLTGLKRPGVKLWLLATLNVFRSSHYLI